MKDTEFYYQLLGLRSPWRVKTVNMDLAGGEVRIEVECASTTWADEDGNILHIHSYEQREWRHLDTCQLQTIIEARVPRVLNPQTGSRCFRVNWVAPPKVRRMRFCNVRLAVSFPVRFVLLLTALIKYCVSLAAKGDCDVALPEIDEKFHASKLLGEGVDKVRRQEHKILTAQGDDTLKKTRTFWLTGLDNMNDRQFFSFEKLVHLTLKTSRAWEIKELFAYFWDQPTKGEAHKYFTKWYGRTMRSRLEPMKKAAATFKKNCEPFTKPPGTVVVCTGTKG
jgi:transposase